MTNVLAETDSNKVPNWAVPGNVVRCIADSGGIGGWMIYDSDETFRYMPGPQLGDLCTIERVLVDTRPLPFVFSHQTRNEHGTILLVLKEWPMTLKNGETDGWGIDAFEPYEWLEQAGAQH